MALENANQQALADALGLRYSICRYGAEQPKESITSSRPKERVEATVLKAVEKLAEAKVAEPGPARRSEPPHSSNLTRSRQ